MRVLHTSDWHLGRNFHGVQLLEAQVKTLEFLVDVVRQEGVEAVVVAGDIYDRAVPSADAVSAFSHLLSEIVGAGASVIGISGNHDSATRVGFAERILSAGGVTLRGDVTRCAEPVIVPDRSSDGAVAFYPIPYLEPETARHALGNPDARSHERLLRLALHRARQDLGERNGVRSVAVVHAFVTGGQESESELALSVGGSAEVPLKSLSGFDYVALGHLHGRQKLGDGRARYSGSPLPYSFSERGHTKGAWLLDVPATGDVRVEAVDFPVHRTLHQVRGTLTDLLTSPAHAVAEDGYVQAILIDPLMPLDAMAKLRRRFPDIVLLGHEPPVSESAPTSYGDRVKGRTDLELALEFVDHVAGRPPTDAEAGDLADAIGAPLTGDGGTDKAVA